VSISSNGYVCLGTNYGCGSSKITTSSDIIVGLNYDLNPTASGSGKIYYQSLSSNSTFFQPVCDIVNSLDTFFIPKNIFMITYDGVYIVSGYDTASFQIFLLTNFLKTYVIFQYASCLNGLSLLSPSGLNFLVSGSLKQIIIENQCDSTNVNQTGVWVYEALGKVQVYLYQFRIFFGF
jgi:hypothetical protein